MTTVSQLCENVREKPCDAARHQLGKERRGMSFLNLLYTRTKEDRPPPTRGKTLGVTIHRETPIGTMGENWTTYVGQSLETVPEVCSAVE